MFMGIGLKKAIGMWVLFVLMTVGAKVIFTKYPVKGVSDIVNAV